MPLPILGIIGAAARAAPLIVKAAKALKAAHRANKARKAAEKAKKAQHKAKQLQKKGKNSKGCKNCNRNLNISDKQLQKKFKHAEDFGVKGAYNKTNAGKFKDAVNAHVNSDKTSVINGTYRGNPATFYLDKSTGLNVIKDSSGSFVSGWKLGSGQLKNVLTKGALN